MHFIWALHQKTKSEGGKTYSLHTVPSQNQIWLPKPNREQRGIKKKMDPGKDQYIFGGWLSWFIQVTIGPFKSDLDHLTHALSFLIFFYEPQIFLDIQLKCLRRSFQF